MNDERAQHDFVLELFVQGQSARSNAALAAVTRVCETRLHGRYSLDVTDILNSPERLGKAGLLVAPALIRWQPEPVVRIVGRLSEARVIRALELTGQKGAAEATCGE